MGLSLQYCRCHRATFNRPKLNHPFYGPRFTHYPNFVKIHPQLSQTNRQTAAKQQAYFRLKCKWRRIVCRVLQHRPNCDFHHFVPRIKFLLCEGWRRKIGQLGYLSSPNLQCMVGNRMITINLFCDRPREVAVITNFWRGYSPTWTYRSSSLFVPCGLGGNPPLFGSVTSPTFFSIF